MLTPGEKNQQKFKIVFLCYEIIRDLNSSTLTSTKSNKLKIAWLGDHCGYPMGRTPPISLPPWKSFGREWWNCHCFIAMSWKSQARPAVSSYLITFTSFWLFSMVLTAYFALTLVSVPVFPQDLGERGKTETEWAALLELEHGLALSQHPSAEWIVSDSGINSDNSQTSPCPWVILSSFQNYILTSDFHVLRFI